MVVARYLLPVAFARHFHVDEVQIAYNAALLGLHRLPEWVNFHGLLVVPLSWIAAAGGETWPRLLEMRALFVGLFLLDLVLVAVSAPRVRGAAARSAVLLAATLVEPLWRHGYEIRHDVLVVAGSLALFALAQRAARGSARELSFLAAGAIAAWMQLNSLKALLIWPPALALLLLAVRPAGAAEGGARPLARARAGLLLAVGFALGAASGLAALASVGLAGELLRQLTSLGGAASEAQRFAPGRRLLALLLELPHLALLAALSCVGVVRALWRREMQRELPSAITVAWLALELVALHLNPVPFTYNFVHLLPFLFLAAVDGFGRLWESAPRLRIALAATAIAATIVAFAHSWSVDRFGRLPSTEQRAHVEAAEALTAPGDPVLDAAGLVLSRRPPARDWMLHSLTMPAYRRGERESFRSQLAREPAPVLLTSYRWEWLGADDRDFVLARYRPLGPRLLVLGGLDPAAAGGFPIHRAGRYRVRFPGAVAEPTIDGQPAARDAVRSLAAGLHAWSGGAVEWIWLGPRLDAPPDPGPLPPYRDLYFSD